MSFQTQKLLKRRRRISLHSLLIALVNIQDSQAQTVCHMTQVKEWAAHVCSHFPPLHLVLALNSPMPALQQQPSGTLSVSLIPPETASVSINLFPNSNYPKPFISGQPHVTESVEHTRKNKLFRARYPLLPG